MLDMHPPILEVRAGRHRLPATAAGTIAAPLALALLLNGATAHAGLTLRPAKPSPECPARASALVEHFIGADCLDCWKAAAGAPRLPGAEAPRAGEWSLDWVLPSPGPDAPLAAAALPESAERLARLGPHLAARLETPPAAFDTATELAAHAAGTRFWVHSSLPWNGYFGVQMHARGRWPEGSTAWVGLVEILPAGVDGTTLERRLVRALTGPVALPASAAPADGVDPLFGMRWPETAQAERIAAVAWIEGRDGRILQIASDRCVDPK
jgi:hypothetical protein